MQVPLVVVQRSVALVPAGTPVTPEVAEDALLIVAVPLTTVQLPEPVVGTLPASVKLPLLQFAWSAPAAADVGNASLVRTTVSVEVQVPLVVVQRSVALVPTGRPVTVDVADDGVVIVAVPLTRLQRPVPTLGALPVSVKDPLLHCSWPLPASAAVGCASLVSTTSSVDAGQLPLVIVQRKVALVPAGTPVTPELAEDAVVIVAVPLTTVQVPVPVVGTFPASVNAPLLHCVWSGPAAAVVGVAYTVPVPVAVVWVVALVVLALTLPDAPSIASDFSRTYIDTPVTVVPVRDTVKDDAKPVPLDREIS